MTANATLVPADITRLVDDAITSRNSTRAFTRQAVPRSTITEMLDVAARAASGTNTQPWKVYVLQGAVRDGLVQKVCAAHDALRANPALMSEYREEYDYYPTQWSAPTLTGAVKTAGACTACWASPKATKTKCTPSTRAITAFLTHRWA